MAVARKHKREPDDIKLVLRLPPAVHRRLTRLAARNNRSLNSEMIERLEASFAADEGEQAGAAQGYRDLEYLKEMHHRLDYLIRWMTVEGHGEKK
jgi:predicted transcriptional regulator